jgi:energy-coupling factor transporter ATP-binding protein EcfA2
LICGERLLLRNNALLLHSSVVFYQGKAILFSGPSGAGKSTQAQLWQEHLGAQIINGDRTVIRKTQDGFLGGGSMWSGSSRIFRPDQAPIAGIFLVEHGNEDQVQRLGFEAFKPLLTQTLVNSWDPAFMEQTVELLSQLIDSVPIYRLSCRPQQSAVDLVHSILFSTERSLP